MNWSVLPWKKLSLLAAAIALATVAARVPETLMIYGIAVQHVLLVAAGAIAGWTKRAPGDVKAA